MYFEHMAEQQQQLSRIEHPVEPCCRCLDHVLCRGVIALMTLGMTSPVLALTMGWVFLLKLMVVTIHSMLFSPLATVFMECTPSVIQLTVMIKQAPSMHTM